MTPKQRDRRFRREQMQRHDKVKPRKGGAKIERNRKTEAYNRDKRSSVKTELRTDWYW